MGCSAFLCRSLRVVSPFDVACLAADRLTQDGFCAGFSVDVLAPRWYDARRQ